jgi:hypothetical protein
MNLYQKLHFVRLHYLESGAKLSLGSEGFLVSFLPYEQPELGTLKIIESLI